MARTGAPVVIGQLAPMAYRFGTEQGAALAVSEINAGGGVLSGRPLQIELRDDRADVDEAVRQFAQLADIGVAAVVGSSDSNSSLALASSIAAREIAYLSTSAADSQVDPVRPFLFMTPPTAGAGAELLLHYLSQAGLHDVGLTFDEESRYATAGLAQQWKLAERFGVRLRGPVAFDRSTTDFGPVVEKIASLDARATMVWATGPTTVALVPELARQAVRVPLLLCPGAATPSFLEAGAAAEGAIVASSLGWLGEQLPESAVRTAAVRFVESYRAMFAAAPSTFAADGYVAVTLIAAAIEYAGDDHPRRIRDALEQVTAMTAQGRYRYTASDHAGLNRAHLAVTVVRDGAFRLTDWSRTRLRTALNSREPASP